MGPGAKHGDRGRRAKTFKTDVDGGRHAKRDGTGHGGRYRQAHFRDWHTERRRPAQKGSQRNTGCGGTV